MTEQEQKQDIFDQIRARADKKRQDRIEEKTKAVEFMSRMKMKSGNNPLDEINRRMTGEKKQ